MNNEERIKHWRDKRPPRPAPDLEDDELDDLAPVGLDRPGRPDRADKAASPAQPHEISLDEARAAISARRRARWRKAVRRVALYVGVPLLAVFAYIAAVATPLHQAEAVFTVQTSSQPSPAGNAGLFGLGSGSSAIADAFKAREFILSRPMMEQMERQHGFMSHFAAPAMDPLQRFQGPLGMNSDPFEYYRKRVRVSVDVQEGILRLYVQALTPAAATRFGNAILAAAEQHVNEFSEKMSADQIAALTRDVEGAERQVADARRALAVVQARRGDLNPEQTATAVYQLISNLELQLAEAERERNALLDQGLTNSPMLPRLTSRVQELRSQIAEQRGRLANPGGGSLLRTVNEFERATARKEIAQARYESTLNTLQQAYLRILEERRYFVIIVGMAAGTSPAVRDILAIAWPILLFVAILSALIVAFRRRGLGGRAGDFRFSETVRRWRRS